MSKFGLTKTNRLTKHFKLPLGHNVILDTMSIVVKYRGDLIRLDIFTVGLQECIEVFSFEALLLAEWVILA